MPSLCGAGDGAKGSTHVRQSFYRLINLATVQALKADNLGILLTKLHVATCDTMKNHSSCKIRRKPEECALL